MSYATRNENGDNMGNTFVRCPIDCTKAEFAERWDACFGVKAKGGQGLGRPKLLTSAKLLKKRAPEHELPEPTIVADLPSDHPVLCACYFCRSSAIGDY